MRCGVLQCVAVCCSALRCVEVRYGVLQCVAVCCGVLQCVEVSCMRADMLPVLQCVAVRCSVMHVCRHTSFVAVYEQVLQTFV